MAGTLNDLSLPARQHWIGSHQLSETGWQLHGVLDVESRVATKPLRTVARIDSGTTGFSAQRVADALRDVGPDDTPDDCRRFIVSGSIDRFVIQHNSVRFMKRVFEHAVLRRDASVLSARKRALFAADKLVVAGMSKRLEVAYDRTGYALGVQVYAISDLQVDEYFLLGLLNSLPVSILFRQRFWAKRLAGGYLAVNKSQLAELPIPISATPADRAAMAAIADLARQRVALTAADAGFGSHLPPDTTATPRAGDTAPNDTGPNDTGPNDTAPNDTAAIDQTIDDLVCRLYRITTQERRDWESTYGDLWGSGIQTRHKIV